MLINGSLLIDCPVLSLHVGGEIARVTELIMNPNSLKLIAFRVEGRLFAMRLATFSRSRAFASSLPMVLSSIPSMSSLTEKKLFASAIF